MESSALALFALAGLGAWLALRSSSANAVPYAGGEYVPVPFPAGPLPYGGATATPIWDRIPGSVSDGSVIYASDYPGGDIAFDGSTYTPTAYDDGGAPWLQVSDPYADAYDYEIGGDATVNSPDPVANMRAMLALIRAVESRGDYYIIAGGDKFTDTREHPFILEPARRRPLGTTASGAYQMVVGTWTMARDALRLADFSPASQDAAAAWLIQYKRPAAYPHVLAGNFTQALAALRREWEAFDKMLSGNYPVTVAQAAQIFTDAGGTIA